MRYIMALTTMSIRVDENDKKRFDEFCDQTGLNASVAVNMYIKAVLRENCIPFEVKADPFYSKENMERLERRIADVKSGKSVLKEHDLIEVD